MSAQVESLQPFDRVDAQPDGGVVGLGPSLLMDTATDPDLHRFGSFELRVAAGELLLDGRRVKLQPQPFKLLCLLVRRAGVLVTRDEIRQALWPDGTFVDFDQAVNFAIRQIRDALRDHADRPLYIETVPRRGYRFIAPVEVGPAQASAPSDGVTVRLEKALWQNVAELRLAEARRRRITIVVLSILAVLVLAALVLSLSR